MKKYFTICVSIIAFTWINAQDSLHQQRFSLHFQTTVITQGHPDFNAKFSGENSLEMSEPPRTSLTSTIFFAYRPLKHTYIVFNPELAGGKGLSKTQGVAGFPNGEVYRVGDPAPKPFIARLYVEQRFPLNKRTETVGNEPNQLFGVTNKDYFSILAGKFSLTDFFDDSEISHDPRTQFMNWSLMGNGAWDYPANTRGYTLGVLLQALYHDWALRYAMTAMPTEANGQTLQWKAAKAMGMVVEIEKTHLIKKDDSHYNTLHAGLFLNQANMGSYQKSIDNSIGVVPPDIADSRVYGRTKWGFYASLDNHFGWLHHFIKGSWNDGANETWAFTEIDRSLATGIKIDGSVWKRKNDHLGLAFVANGISDVHQNYLAKGGYGFIIGDGALLNYQPEKIIEAYYSFSIWKQLYISPDYQFISNPAYNADRGPVHLFSLRMHAQL